MRQVDKVATFAARILNDLIKASARLNLLEPLQFVFGLNWEADLLERLIKKAPCKHGATRGCKKRLW